MIILYTQRCLACSNRPLSKKLRAFATEHGLAIEERRVGMSKTWKAESKGYNIALPFVVYRNSAVSLSGDLEELLK